MKRRSSNIHALIVSLAVCFVCMQLSLLLWKRIVDMPAFLPFAFLVAIFFVIGLSTYILYTVLKVPEGTQELAKNIAKDMLMYSHELFSELYRSSPVPYILIDGEGVIESANYATARLFNVKEGDLSTQNVFTLMSGKDETKTALIPEYYKQGKFINDLEVQIHCPDGTTKWVMLSLFSFHDGKGVQKGLLTLVDITKQKMVDWAKTEFVSLASHQLRTPISAMKWNMELLETTGKDALNTVQATYIRKIVNSLSRMDALVSDFLSASKLELGTLRPELSAIEVKEFLKNIYDEHTVLGKQKKITLTLDIDAVNCIITSDAHLLHMVITNLMSNAIKYTKEGGAVRLSATERGEEIVVTVTDTGIGIPLEDQKMLFTKMFRASNARIQMAEGTGLGLYIVKEIVKVLGGTIAFESTPEVGTTFTVTLRK